jgi:hypothetical protein
LQNVATKLSEITRVHDTVFHGIPSSNPSKLAFDVRTSHAKVFDPTVRRIMVLRPLKSCFAAPLSVHLCANNRRAGSIGQPSRSRPGGTWIDDARFTRNVF